MQHIKYICLSLLVSLFATVAMAQNQTYSGTVVDENGDPVIGASVIVAGQDGVGVITDFDGNYTIQAPKGAKVTITFIGYMSQTVVPGGKVQLKEDSQKLEEVVVVGYGLQKKAHLTGSVATVNVEEMQDLAGGDISSKLTGLVNGLGVQSGSNRPGESSSLSIRGANNLSAIGVSAQSPLYVIDGFILDADAFNNLDPSSIENISVLKDASAAVYGARAANGVILVTTKKGKMGKPQISYSGNFGITDAVSTPKMLNTYNYGRLWNAVRAADPTETTLNNRYDLFQADELEAMKSLNYNLLDKYWETAVTQQHSVNLGGATDNANYYAGISYFNQDGNLGKMDYDRWNFRAGVDLKISNHLKASLQVSGDYGKQNKPLMKVQDTASDRDYMMLLSHAGYIPEEINGMPIANYGISNSQINAAQCYNYDYLQNQSKDYMRNMTQNMYLNGSIEYDFGWSKQLKGLKLKFTYAKSISTTKSNEMGTPFNVYRISQRAGSGEHLYTPYGDMTADVLYADNNFLLGNNNASISNGRDGGYISRRMSRADKYQFNFVATYNRKFGLHDISALFSIEKSEYEFEDNYAEGTRPYEFSTGQWNSLDTSNGGLTTSTFERSESGTMSYVGRINYVYNDRYLLEFLVRSDASTKFAPENYWGTFPSLSAGWVISQEDWFRNALKWVDHMKVRASWGLTGRDNVPAWRWLQTYTVASDKGAIIGSSNPPAGSHITAGSAINRDMHWDKSYKGNIGLDFSVLNNRLGVNFDAYYVWDREMLMAYGGSVPSTVGSGSAPLNYGEMDSWGFELSLNWKDKIGKDFKYRVGLNTGLSDNKVLERDWRYLNNDDAYKAIQRGGRTDVGLWGLQCIGMFRSFQDIEEYFAKNNITSYLGKTKDEIRPGMLIYKDIRGSRDENGNWTGPDGKVDETLDLVQISHRSNPYHFNLNLGADYKAFSLTAQVNASWGGYGMVPGSALTPNDGSNSNWRNLEYINMPSFWNPDDMYVYQDVYDASGNLLVKENRDACMPNMRYADINNKTSTYWRISSARVTLSRITLAYSLPKDILQKVGVQACRINVTGQNMLSLYNPYPDNFIDPMSSYGVYPALRKFTVGLNITF